MQVNFNSNKVYFSPYLRAYKCWKNIKKTLDDNNVPFFTDQVKNCITQVLHKMEVKAKPADRRYLAGIITNEYEHQYKRF